MNDEVEQERRAACKAYRARLDWLQSVAGEAAVLKFRDAKVGAPPYGSQYVSSAEGTLEGYRTLIELLDQLKDGLAVPSVDVDSYYAHGKRWPAGMRLEGNRLVNTWPESDRSLAVTPAPSQETEPVRPEDFEFDFSSLEIPKHELTEDEAADLANKLFAAMSDQSRKAKNSPKPRK